MLSRTDLCEQLRIPRMCSSRKRSCSRPCDVDATKLPPFDDEILQRSWVSGRRLELVHLDHDDSPRAVRSRSKDRAPPFSSDHHIGVGRRSRRAASLNSTSCIKSNNVLTLKWKSWPQPSSSYTCPGESTASITSEIRHPIQPLPGESVPFRFLGVRPKVRTTKSDCNRLSESRAQ